MPRPKKPVPIDPLLPRPEVVLGGGTLGVARAAELLDVSERTIFELLRAGELSSTKVGRKRLIPRKSLMKLLAEQFVPGRR